MGCGPRFRQGENVSAPKVLVNKVQATNTSCCISNTLIKTGSYKIKV